MEVLTDAHHLQHQGTSLISPEPGCSEELSRREIVFIAALPLVSLALTGSMAMSTLVELATRLGHNKSCNKIAITAK